MLKQTYGFDTDIFKRGTPVIIEDSITFSNRSGELVSFRMDRPEDYNYYDENKSDTYLVAESSSTMLRLINVHGQLVLIPIKHFIGENPRMIINTYN